MKREKGDLPWPFVESRNSDAYVSVAVLEEKEKLSWVIHDQDGDWQFLGDSDGEEIAYLPLEGVYQMFPVIAPLISRLERGWAAQWSSEGNEWIIGIHMEPAL